MGVLSENILIYSIAAILCVVVVGIYLWKKRRESKRHTANPLDYLYWHNSYS